jgi:hypothetical protein
MREDGGQSVDDSCLQVDRHEAMEGEMTPSPTKNDRRGLDRMNARANAIVP